MNKHQTFDKEEQQIFKAFSQIEVNTDNLERSIANVNHERAKRPMKLSFAMIALAVFLLVSGTVYAATGGLEQILERFNPDFGEFAVPPLEPAYMESLGIRFEVYGAQVFDNLALIYYSLQDVSGENRLHERIGLDYVIVTDDEGLIQGGSSTRRLHFDRRNNTLYFEARIVVENTLPSQFRVGGRHIRYYPEEGGVVLPYFTGNWVVDVNVDDTINQVIIWEDAVTENVHIDRMVLSPLGLHVRGSYIDGSWDIDDHTTWFDRPEIIIECSHGLNNSFNTWGGGIGPDGFDKFFYLESSIDVAEITAVIVDGVRIPIP